MGKELMEFPILHRQEASHFCVSPAESKHCWVYEMPSSTSCKQAVREKAFAEADIRAWRAKGEQDDDEWAESTHVGNRGELERAQGDNFPGHRANPP